MGFKSSSSVVFAGIFLLYNQGRHFNFLDNVMVRSVQLSYTYPVLIILLNNLYASFHSRSLHVEIVFTVSWNITGQWQQYNAYVSVIWSRKLWTILGPGLMSVNQASWQITAADPFDWFQKIPYQEMINKSAIETRSCGSQVDFDLWPWYVVGPLWMFRNDKFIVKIFKKKR